MVYNSRPQRRILAHCVALYPDADETTSSPQLERPAKSLSSLHGPHGETLLTEFTNAGNHLRRHARQRLLKFCPRAAACCADSGSVTLETALAFMLTMTLVLGIIEFSMMAYTYSVIEDSARDGVHYACVHGSDSTTCSGPSPGCTDASGSSVTTEVLQYAQRYLAPLNASNVSVSYPDGNSDPGSRIQVVITYSYQPLFHLPGANQTLQVSSASRIIY